MAERKTTRKVKPTSMYGQPLLGGHLVYDAN